VSETHHDGEDCVGELERIDRLFDSKRTLPMLAKVVIDRIGVRELPYTDIPLICSALYRLKEFWREKLLMMLIDDALRCIKREVERPRPLPSLSKAAFFYGQANMAA
jgi:hypothetical protein